MFPFDPSYVYRPYPTFMRDMKEKLAHDIADYPIWSNNRGKDFISVARGLYMIDEANKGLEPTTIRIESWLTADKEVPDKFHRIVSTNFNILAALVIDSKHDHSFD